MLWSDLTFAVRGLIGAPGLSAAAVVALALGIGPNTAIFSIVYATLLAPLPFSNPDQLARVTPMAGNAQDRASAAEYLEWKKRATSFQALEAFRPGRTLNLAIRRRAGDRHRATGHARRASHAERTDVPWA